MTVKLNIEVLGIHKDENQTADQSILKIRFKNKKISREVTVKCLDEFAEDEEKLAKAFIYLLLGK